MVTAFVTAFGQDKLSVAPDRLPHVSQVDGSNGAAHLWSKQSCDCDQSHLLFFRDLVVKTLQRTAEWTTLKAER